MPKRPVSRCSHRKIPWRPRRMWIQRHRSSPASTPTTLDPAAQQLYGIRLAKVEMEAGQGAIRVFGRVVPDQTLVYRVNLGTDGYVKETHDDAVGNHVMKDQHLAIVYSPEFLAVAGGFLSANERTSAGTAATKDNVAPSTTLNASSAQARADRLRNLGMSDSQIDEISKDRKLPENVYVVSPADTIFTEPLPYIWRGAFIFAARFEVGNWQPLLTRGRGQTGGWSKEVFGDLVNEAYGPTPSEAGLMWKGLYDRLGIEAADHPWRPLIGRESGR